MSDFHFLRPLWLLVIIPFLGLIWRLWRQNSHLESWAAVCDRHLLKYLIQTKGQQSQHNPLLWILISVLFMVIGLAGPTWSRLPVPTYQFIQPRVILLDMSDAMLAQDLPPDRLSRAKFKLHDLLMHHDLGQLGLVVYTGEPFVVSPLTDDAKTIDALLTSLTPDIMPVAGEHLARALEQAGQLITHAGFDHGQLLVLTANPPDSSAINAASVLAAHSILTSIMPVVAQKSVSSSFHELALAGKGEWIPFTQSTKDLELWLKKTPKKRQYQSSQHADFPLWRDEGRWFLLPAFVFFLPIFRRGWLQRIDV